MLKSLLGRRTESALLYILQSGNLYGTERMALSTLQSLDEYRFRALFAPAPTGSSGGSVAEAAKSCGFESLLFETRWGLIKALIPWFIRFGQIDVIGNGVAQSFICKALSIFMRVRIRQLHIVHGGTEDHHAYGSKFHLNRLSVRLIAVSDFVKTRLVHHGVRENAIDVIDNFVADSQVVQAVRRAPYLRQSPGADGALVNVAVVSRIDPIKRIELLIEAVERDGLGQFQFDIFGTGIELERLRTRSARLPNVRFHGYVVDVEQRLARADFLLHLCPNEPFGLAILEAFIAGVLAVVPSAGGAGGIVEDGITGFKFEPDDVEDLIRTLYRAAASDAQQLQVLADEAAHRLESRFSQREGAVRYRESFSRLV